MSELKAFLKSKFPNEEYVFSEVIQSLWSGYGSIERWVSQSGNSIVIKHIKFPNQKNHPRGWNSDIGHLRKVKSYEVENTWYKDYGKDCAARLPELLAKGQVGESQVIVLEDLNKSGYHLRASYSTETQIRACISWLAEFHASHLYNSGDGLWPIGTYWHLATRPEELEEMEEGPLKEHATDIDKTLNGSKYKTLVHGDAKLANFCFSENDEVAAVDFQYVGLGCGIKDLIYFISSVEDFESKKREGEILNFYFDELARFLGERNEALESEWRELYKYAWADFNRFLQGWSPGHWKLNSYVDQITEGAILGIQLKKCLETAKLAAKEAGTYIQKSVNKNHKVDSKGDGLSLASSIVTEVDVKSQGIIIKYIKPLIYKYNYGLLSEELKDDASRFEKEYFWCIDPLDGTLPFTEQTEGYSVAISLVSKLGEPVLGVVYNPITSDLYEGLKGNGARKNGQIINVNPSSKKFTFITDRSFTKASNYDLFINELKEKAIKKGLTEFEIIAHGGASMNAIWVIENAPAAYIKPPKENLGGGGLWDFAASACIFKELGLRATNYEGGDLDLNRRDATFMNHEGVWFEV